MPDKLLTFVHISDTHIHADPDFTGDHVDFSSRSTVQALIDTINTLEMDIDAVIHTGDITHNPEEPEHYHIAKEILDQINYPTYYIPGNHDNVLMFQEEFLGLQPSNINETYDYHFELNGVQFIMLDSHRPITETGSHGLLTEPHLAWLDLLLSAEDARPLIVGIHHHTLPTEAPWLDNIILKNGLDLHQILLKAQSRLRGVFCGHIHESLVTVRDGISYYSVQSAWFQTRTWYDAQDPAHDFIPNAGFNLVTLTESDTFVRFHRIAL
ncbi:MAG: metallophosphoesterase [Chloroflexota bacterium]